MRPTSTRLCTDGCDTAWGEHPLLCATAGPATNPPLRPPACPADLPIAPYLHSPKGQPQGQEKQGPQQVPGAAPQAGRGSRVHEDERSRAIAQELHSLQVGLGRCAPSCPARAHSGRQSCFHA